MKNEFRQAKEAIDGVEKAMQDLQQRIEMKCSWEDPEDVAVYKGLVRRVARGKVLDKLVPDRVCSNCGETRFSDRSWIINTIHTKAVCRSCFSMKELVDKNKLTVKIFSNPCLRYDIDGAALRTAREVYGISRGRFARLMGWHSSHQFQLESGNALTVSEEKALKIIYVFDRLEKVQGSA